ncbi:MAG: oligosaccharide flippase family protein [archaeon]
MPKRIIHKLKNDSLLRDSAVLFSAGIIVNILNYAFQLYMGRSLGPADYGIFASIVSLLYIVSVPAGTINISIARFVSGFLGRKELGKAKYLFFKGLGKVTIFGAAGFAAISIISPYIASFLNIPAISPVVILGLVFFMSMIGPVANGTLQGLQRFRKLGAVQVANASAKLILGIALVSIGFGVNGALGSLALAGFFGFGLSVYFLRDILKKESARFDKNRLISYSYPVFISLFLINVMSNIDVILVKHYFTEAQAGHYAAAALIGKLVLFASGAVTGVMFAKVAELKAIGKPAKKMLYESMFYIFAISFAAVTVYFVAPHFVLSLLFGSSYIPAVPLIGLFGLAMGFFALANVLVQYNLAVKEKKFIWILAVAAVAEVAMIIMFHDSLMTVLKILTVTMALIFSSLLIMAGKEIIE